MDLIKLPKFDHSQESLGGVIGMSEYEQHYVKTAILFEILSTRIRVKDLFEDPEEAPVDMSTMSGLMEKALRHAKTFEQQIYVLMEFQLGYSHTIHGIMALEEAATKKLEEEAANSVEGDLKNLLSRLVDRLKTAPLQATMDEVIKCDHDFDKFINSVIPKKNYDENGNCRVRGGRAGGANLDDIIRKSLGDIPGIEFRSGDPDDDGDDDE